MFSLKKDQREGGLNIMAIMHFDLVSVRAHVSRYVKRKHATSTPVIIDTEVAWSSLNNLEYTS